MLVIFCFACRVLHSHTSSTNILKTTLQRIRLICNSMVLVVTHVVALVAVHHTIADRRSICFLLFSTCSCENIYKLFPLAKVESKIQSIWGGKLLWFIYHVYYVGKTFVNFRFAALTPRAPLQYIYVHQLWQNTKLTVQSVDREFDTHNVTGKKEIQEIRYFYWALMLAQGSYRW